MIKMKTSFKGTKRHNKLTKSYQQHQLDQEEALQQSQPISEASQMKTPRILKLWKATVNSQEEQFMMSRKK